MLRPVPWLLVLTGSDIQTNGMTLDLGLVSFTDALNFGNVTSNINLKRPQLLRILILAVQSTV